MSLVTRTRRGQLNWNWRTAEHYCLNGSVSPGRSRDSCDRARSDSQTWAMQANNNLDLNVKAAKAVPVRLFLRCRAENHEPVNTCPVPISSIDRARSTLAPALA
ncbi:MAG: hypothetical protein FJY37_08555 [Betaproteobacteria bacterium]|nr:hypothetical protein [Betaproteobacteria bacterium]